MHKVTVSPGDVLVLKWAGDADHAMVAQALGAGLEDPAHLVVFDAAKIAPLGLTAYLADGHGIASADLSPFADKLDGLAGTIAVLSARGFAENRAELKLGGGLALIATFNEATAAIAAPLPIETESAKGNLSGAPTKPAKSDARVGGMIAFAVLVFLALFVVFIVMSAG